MEGCYVLMYQHAEHIMHQIIALVDCVLTNSQRVDQLIREKLLRTY